MRRRLICLPIVQMDHHPVCAAEEATRRLFDRAATPPRRGGEKSLTCVGQQPTEPFKYAISAVAETKSNTRYCGWKPGYFGIAPSFSAGHHH